MTRGLREDERPAGDTADPRAAGRKTAQRSEGRPIIERRRIAAGADQQQIEFSDIADFRSAWNCSAAGRCRHRVSHRDVHPAIKLSSGEKVGGAQRLDDARVRHQRKAGHQQQPNDLRAFLSMAQI